MSEPNETPPKTLPTLQDRTAPPGVSHPPKLKELKAKRQFMFDSADHFMLAQKGQNLQPNQPHTEEYHISSPRKSAEPSPRQDTQ